MTGYGQGDGESDGFHVRVELRSVNHRFLDVRLRLPGEIHAMERELRAQIQAAVARGRVEVGISLRREAGDAPTKVLNRPVVQSVLRAGTDLRNDYGIDGRLDLQTLLTVPGIFTEEGPPEDLSEGEASAVKSALATALQVFNGDREREGERLAAEIGERLETMMSIAGSVKERAAIVPNLAKERLEKRLEALAADVEMDPSRLAQEVAFLAERADITEEVVRLESHLDQAKELVSVHDGEPVGKRLDFLLQEILRETNTVNSKSSDLEISRMALELKAETEKVREQIQNLE